MDNTWVEGKPSSYQRHDFVHFPDWKNIIVWDFFCNNLASGFGFIAILAWLVNPELFSPVTPIAVTLAFFIVAFDLLLLVIDLGDHIRFIHAMRVVHPTSPLSIGVWSLIPYTILLFLALVVYWGTLLLNATIGVTPEFIAVADVLYRLFLVLALIAGVFVICYKGVAFSCTSQPGVKRARWLACWVGFNALTIGMSLLVLVSFVLGQAQAVAILVIPLILLIIFCCMTFTLVWMDIHKRAELMYSKGHLALNAAVVYGLAGVCAIAACFFGPIGMAVAAAISLFGGIWERYFVIFVTHPH